MGAAARTSRRSEPARDTENGRGARLGQIRAGDFVGAVGQGRRVQELVRVVWQSRHADGLQCAINSVDYNMVVRAQGSEQVAIAVCRPQPAVAVERATREVGLTSATDE